MKKNRWVLRSLLLQDLTHLLSCASGSDTKLLRQGQMRERTHAQPAGHTVCVCALHRVAETFDKDAAAGRKTRVGRCS